MESRISGDLPDEFFGGDKLLRLYRLITATDRDLARFQITRPELDPQRHAFLDPFPIFHAAAEIAPVDLHFDRRAEVALARSCAASLSAASQTAARRLFLRRDRHNHDMSRRNPRRQDQSIIVRVRHDEGADHPRGHAPARRPAKLLFPARESGT